MAAPRVSSDHVGIVSQPTVAIANRRIDNSVTQIKAPFGTLDMVDQIEMGDRRWQSMASVPITIMT